MARRPTWAVLAIVAATALVALGVIASAAIGSAPAAAPGSAQAAQTDCSLATADQILASLGYEPELPGGPIAGQALCGPFMGPGSQAMVVTLAHGACKPNSGWSVLGLVNGAWKVVFPGDNIFGVMPFTALGSDFRETLPVFLAGDPICSFGNGGTRGRRWHWNGTKFVHGPFKWLTVGAEFWAPGRKVGCRMGDYPGGRDSSAGGAFCFSGTKPLTASIRLGGRIYLCPVRGQKYCYGGIVKRRPVLAYGEEKTVGRFRCESLRRGVRCTKTKTGKGFLLNAHRVKLIPSRR
jgi:hypothetical protein